MGLKVVSVGHALAGKVWDKGDIIRIEGRLGHCSTLGIERGKGPKRDEIRDPLGNALIYYSSLELFWPLKVKTHDFLMFLYNLISLASTIN